MSEIHATGAATPETSYYPAFRNLVNSVGTTLKPQVKCVMNPANQGGGLPDGNFFTANQFQHKNDTLPREGQLPERGALELKPLSHETTGIARSKQVKGYLSRYGVVLVSNFREFVVVAVSPNGTEELLESYTLEDTEIGFWQLAAHPKQAVEQHGERFLEFLRRALLQNVPLAKPEDLAWFLGSYARDARVRIEQSELPALRDVRQGLEEALGITFKEEDGAHFFRSTLIQTLFYGIFSSWVLWCKEKPTEPFDWKQAAWTLYVPMIGALFDRVATPTKIKSMGLLEPLEWASTALERVDRKTFFANFDEGHAVQYFYEPFLERFDPELRKDLGVWYTPPEIVKYMVARVDAVLREELDIPDGLADERVYILDPCCGTGAFLVETLNCIGERLRSSVGDALAAAAVKHAAMKRVFGFELMPAPFVVAHLQLGLLLQRLHAPLEHSTEERAAIYLTNALTGWEPPTTAKQQLSFTEMEEEREAAEEIKREKPILVVLGNPPYNAFAGVALGEEKGLVEVYKQGLNTPQDRGGWGIRKFNLDDLYVRFFRLAERRIAEKTGQGIVAFISNFSYLDDPSFVVMRKRLLNEFDSIWIDCLNGDSRETGKRTPDGQPDPSVFSTKYHRVGIRVGTSIGLFCRQEKNGRSASVRYRNFWGVSKLDDLLVSLTEPEFNDKYQLIDPIKEFRYAFRPVAARAIYLEWPRVSELAGIPPFNGPIERRGMALMGFDRNTLSERIRKYFDASISDEVIKAIHASLMMTGNRIVGPEARAKVLSEFRFDIDRIVRYPVKPFDLRWCYLENLRPLFSEPSPELLAHRDVPGNFYLLTRDTADKSNEGPPFFMSHLVCDYDCLSGHARHFPVWTFAAASSTHGDQTTFDLGAVANLSQKSRQYLKSLGFLDLDSPETAPLIWHHVLAIGFSSAYLDENEGAVRLDWPRIPLPASAKLLRSSAFLGARVADLLDMESAVSGITSGKILRHLQTVGVLTSPKGKKLDLEVRAGWGRAQDGGKTMPGKGRVVARAYSSAEIDALKEGAEVLQVSYEDILACLGSSTFDIYINDSTFWSNIPARAWEYTLGGYQVLKKWLSYREYDLIDRPLTHDEAKDAMNIARRISTLLLMEPALRQNYIRATTDSYKWYA